MAFFQRSSRNSPADAPPPGSGEYTESGVPITQLDNSDKLSLTLCIAIVIHFFIVLGISFVPEREPPKHRYNSIEVTLVQHESDKAPEEATALAPKNLDAGNSGDEDVNPLEKDDAPIPDERPELTAPPEMLPTPPEALTENTDPDSLSETPQAEPEHETVMTRELETAELEQQKTPDMPAAEQPEPATELPPQVVQTPLLPSASELISSSFQIAALSAQIQRKLENKAKRPRRKFISAATREYRFASYMEAWRAKVERFGNLNYPKEVQERSLSGNLIMDVALLPDGSIDSVSIKRSSKNPLIDEAAIKIVKMAAPYAPFPDSFRSDTDVLHITRTWRFSDGRQFQ